jgi:hypothetical protein
MRLLTFLALSALSAVCALPAAVAQDTPSADGAPAVTETQSARFAVGFQSSWPTYGLSGQYFVSDKLTAEAVAGVSGSLTNVGGRALYRFRELGADDSRMGHTAELYGFGGLGMWRYSDLFDDSETALGASVGIGAEAFLEHILGAEGEPFLPITVSAEVGLAFVGFETYGGFSALSYGAGVHYRF